MTLVALARFCSNFQHTLTIRRCMFCRKLKGQYCKSDATLYFNCKLFTIVLIDHSAYFVKSTTPRAFSVSF